VLNKTGPQSIHILRGVRQQQDEPGRFSICSRQAAVVLPYVATLYRLPCRSRGIRTIKPALNVFAKV
ncbi:hypothetical protein QS554_25395, partial [Escherichia coli]|nr:hypothetical protein [Escherichia coli]